MQPLTVVTRNDLPCGYLYPQVAHATAQYAIEHPECFSRWDEHSGFLIVLAVDSPEELYRLHNKTPGAVAFIEPDVGYEMTAFAVVPDPTTREQNLKPLQLARGNPEMSLGAIRKTREIYKHLPPIEWKPRETWDKDREDFEKHVRTIS